ncbi:DM1 locus, WD repeat containing, partial [Homo sapiens]
GTQPTCHDFNQFTAATETISLLVGFSAGQVQYLDLIKKDTSKLFNEEDRCCRIIHGDCSVLGQLGLRGDTSKRPYPRAGTALGFCLILSGPEEVFHKYSQNE